MYRRSGIRTTGRVLKGGILECSKRCASVSVLPMNRSGVHADVLKAPLQLWT